MRQRTDAVIKLARDAWPEARWWTSFDDSQLDELITRALRDSPTLALAATRSFSMARGNAAKSGVATGSTT